MNFLRLIVSSLVALGTLFTPTPKLGAAVPTIQALFETSLQASITSNATSATLVSGTDLAGNSLNGYYCFTIDAGTVQNEFTCGNASGTALTNLVRGVNPALGITANTGLQFTHRRGADVKITDAPYLSVYSNIFNGIQGIPTSTYYDAGVTTSTLALNTQNLASVAYVNGVAIAGAPAATAAVPGISLVATGSQLYNNLGSSPYFSLAPSTLFTGTASSGMTYSVPVAQSGTIAAGFITGTSPSFQNLNVSGTPTFATATSGVLTTNTSGAVSAVQPGTSGNILQSNGSAWASTAATIPTKSLSVLSATVLIGTSSFVTVQSITLPTLATSTRYLVLGHVTYTSAAGSSTITIGNTALVSCSDANLADLAFQLDIQMAASTSQAYARGSVIAGSTTCTVNGVVSSLGSSTISVNLKSGNGVANNATQNILSVLAF